MDAVDVIRGLVSSTRAWRESVIHELEEMGFNDLAYRPCTGMSAYGWLLAHHGAVYDYNLNILIQGGEPKYPDMFYSYRGDSTDNGEWKGTSLDDINEYFDSTERDFLLWLESTPEEELSRTLDGPEVSQYYKGKRVIDALTDMFAHLNHHNGHLSTIKGDWTRKQRGFL